MIASSLQWGRIGSRSARELSGEAELSLDLRLLLLTMGSANSAGHAYFPDAAESLLTRVNETTGEVTLYGQRRLREVVRALIDAGALSMHSTRRCLVLADGLWSTGTMRVPSTPCPAHQHQMRWTAHGWSDEVDEAKLRGGTPSAASARR